MLWTTVKAADDKILGIQTNRNKKNQNTSSNVGDASSIDRIGYSNKNLSAITKLKNLSKSKKKSDFVKAHFFKIDFLIFEAKEAFIHL